MDMFPFHNLSNYQFKNLDKQLFLPDDVLGLISALSKPFFRYPHEYEDALRVLNKREWPRLKEKLSGPKAEQGLDCLNRFLAARIVSEHAEKAYRRPDHELTAEEYEQARTEYYTATCNRLDILGEILD
jgi:hypothetical protein